MATNTYLLNGQYYQLDHTNKIVWLDNSGGAGTLLSPTGASYGQMAWQVIQAAIFTQANTLLSATPITTITDANSVSDTILSNAVVAMGPQLVTGIAVSSSDIDRALINGAPAQ